ncbi:SHC-transforming protein 1-like isoform X2 [Convolutriloba macropyga]|uniref:SHC-transforming protein 1-like isoform X2 n=1 Tax=Convolutriloba macropyga TaxID=536237 RepID=UPI003F525777
MSPSQATTGFGPNMNMFNQHHLSQQQQQMALQQAGGVAIGWNQTSGSLSAKPASGWLHPDESLLGDGVRFHVNYVGCVKIKESMRNLDFDKRTLLAREAICQVVHFTHYKRLINWTPNENLQKGNGGVNLGSMIDTQYVTPPSAGSRVLLSISTEAITLMSVSSVAAAASQLQPQLQQPQQPPPLLKHEMSSISFASGGDGETSEFIGYVAKDYDNMRACHVVEVPALAPDVIATIGQAFELRYKQHIQGGGGGAPTGQMGMGGAVGGIGGLPSNTNGVLRTGPQMISHESKWGDETASQCSQNTSFNNQMADRRHSKDPTILAPNTRPPMASNFPEMNSQRNSQYFSQNAPRHHGFDDNFVSQNPTPYINMNQNGQMPPTGNGFPGNMNQPMSVRTDLNNTGNAAGLSSGNNNFRNSYPSSNGMDPMTSPNQQQMTQQQRQMHTFYQSTSPPVPAPRKTTPGQVTFSDHNSSSSSQAASNLANIMNQSRHVQNNPSAALNPPDQNAPRVPDRRSPKPTEGGRLVASPIGNAPMPDILSNNKPTSNAVNKAGNRTSTASSCDENLVAIPQTESVLPLGSQVWFHGAISRTESERRLKKDGDFLVREKQLTTAAGGAGSDSKQYVLSGFQGGVVKHLLLVDPHGRVRTKNNIFESVGHLITHHMRNNIPIISSDSQVRLGNPVKKPTPPRAGMLATDI